MFLKTPFDSYITGHHSMNTFFTPATTRTPPTYLHISAEFRPYSWLIAPYQSLANSHQPTNMFSCANQPRGCRGRCDSVGGKCRECRVRSSQFQHRLTSNSCLRCTTFEDQLNSAPFSQYLDSRPTLEHSTRNLRHLQSLQSSMPLTSAHRTARGTSWRDDV